MRSRDEKCSGAHTWHTVANWHDTGEVPWTEEACQKCGLLRRTRDASARVKTA